MKSTDIKDKWRIIPNHGKSSLLRRGAKLPKKLQGWGEKVITALSLDPGIESDSLVLLVMIIVDHDVQELVILLDGVFERLSNKGILPRWILATSELLLAGRKSVRIDPA
jgi:hypothetical protein